jgi:hypothetical protein
MNAILREYEAPVLTNEAIEVHLSYVRSAVEGLAQKLDQFARESVARDEALAQKIDQVSKESIARDQTLAAKIEKTNETLIERTWNIQGSIDGLKWFIASIAVILSGFSIAHSLGWI